MFWPWQQRLPEHPLKLVDGPQTLLFVLLPVSRVQDGQALCKCPESFRLRCDAGGSLSEFRILGRKGLAGCGRCVHRDRRQRTHELAACSPRMCRVPVDDGGDLTVGDDALMGMKVTVTERFSGNRLGHLQQGFMQRPKFVAS